MTERERDPAPKMSAIPGFAVIACMITGVYGIAHTARTDDSGGLIAAAIAFGIVVYSTLR